ncbi:metalloregulator ArsR/SmtB family transcription factor [Desulfosporosinus sp.]|uniref:metalloregulator ArsR/SmtB family transcription factor n=1 Tax=Desulfosporosinus sp. TaxID=157907 RepID=UPI00261694E1|nr:metalloregulator ArsR/SmtB family transcription factor [Desulfosporosinus sp.]
MLTADLPGQAEILRVLGEPHRLAIFTLLSTGPLQVKDLCTATSLSLPLVSQHLRVLRRIGLVQARRELGDARGVWYSIEPQPMTELKSTMSWLFDVASTVDRRPRADQFGIPAANCQDSFRVLFLCTANSARSQMAEALLEQVGGGLFEARSAGTQPRELHPLTVKALAEIGIDASEQTAKHYDVIASEPFRYVITVCDLANEECPELPGDYRRVHWSIADPLTASGTETEVYSAFVCARENLSRRIRLFVHAHRGEAERSIHSTTHGSRQPEEGGEPFPSGYSN